MGRHGAARARPGSGLAGRASPGPPGSSSYPAPVPAGHRVPRGAQPGQVRLAGPPDHCPTAVNRSCSGSGERADRDRHRAGQQVDPPLRGARVGSASNRCHVPAARSWTPEPDSTTRASTRDNATAGTPHLIHVDLRDLHDHRGVLVLTTGNLTQPHASQAKLAKPEHAGALALSQQLGRPNEGSSGLGSLEIRFLKSFHQKTAKETPLAGMPITIIRPGVFTVAGTEFNRWRTISLCKRGH